MKNYYVIGGMLAGAALGAFTVGLTFLSYTISNSPPEDAKKYLVASEALFTMVAIGALSIAVTSVGNQHKDNAAKDLEDKIKAD